MPEQLEAELSLDLAQANRDIDSLRSDIEDAFSRSVDSFSEDFSAAVRDIGVVDVPVDAETDTIAPEIDAAVASADTQIEPTVDTSEIEGQLGLAFDQADTNLDPTVDTRSIEEQLTLAFDGFDPPPIDATVEVDTTDAQSALDDLGDSATDAGGGLSNLDTAQKGLDISASAATGSAAGLGGALRGMGGEIAFATGGLVVGAGVVHHFFEEAVDAIGATQRFESTLGDMRQRVEELRDIEGLNTTLGKLALSLGTDDDALRNSASTAFRLATASGAARKEAAAYTQQLVVLAARSVAANPALGSVASVADRLALTLARGGPRLARMGIDINAAAISARALADTGKDSVRELTFVEKAMAGASLAAEKYGNDLGKVIKEGTENAIIEHKRLQQSLREVYEALGKPLVAPLDQLLEESIPVARAFGTVFASLASGVIPALNASLAAVTPFLEAFAFIIDKIPQPVLTMIAALITFRLAAGPLSTVLYAVGGGIDQIGRSAGQIGAPVSAAGKGLGFLGTAADENRGKFAAMAAGLVLGVQGFQEISREGGNAAVGTLEMTAAGAALGSVIPGVGTGLGALAGFTVGVGTAMFSSADGAEELTKQIQELADAADTLGKEKAAQQFLDELHIGFFDLSNAPALVAAELKKLAVASPAAAAKVRAGLDEMGATAGYTTRQVRALDAAVESGSDKFATNARRAKAASDANNALAGSATQAAGSTKQQADALEAANTKLQAYAANVQGAANTNAEFASSVESQISGKATTVGEAFDSMTKAVQSFSGSDVAVPDISGFSKSLDESQAKTELWLSTVRDLFSRGLTGLASLVLQRGPDATKALADQIAKSGPEQVAAWDKSILEGIQGAVAGAQEAKKIGEQLSAKAAEGIKSDPNDLLEAMKTKLTGLVKFSQAVDLLLKEGLTGIAGKLEGLGADAAGQYIDGLLSMTAEQRAALNLNIITTDQAIAEQQKHLDEAGTKTAAIVGSGAELLEARYRAGIAPIPTDIETAMAQAQAAIIDKVNPTGEAAKRVGVAVPENIRGGIDSSKQQALDAASAVALGLDGVFQQIPPRAYDIAFGAGRSIGSGLADGIADDQSTRDIQQSIDEQLDALDRYLYGPQGVDGGSPSRRYAPIGVSIAQGIGLGFTRGMRDVGSDFNSFLSGPGSVPSPPGGASPFQIQVVVPPSSGTSIDSSISVGAVHNYGPDMDRRGFGLIGALRDLQFTGGGNV